MRDTAPDRNGSTKAENGRGWGGPCAAAASSVFLDRNSSALSPFHQARNASSRLCAQLVKLARNFSKARNRTTATRRIKIASTTHFKMLAKFLKNSVTELLLA